MICLELRALAHRHPGLFGLLLRRRAVGAARAVVTSLRE
jgi:hypothetical protein